MAAPVILMPIRTPVTTNQTIAADLRRSLQARRRVRTLAEFIDAALEAGIRLNEPLASIEFGVTAFGNGQLVLEMNDSGDYEIREGIHGRTS